MLFVFLVDSGTTLPLQMDLALEKVDTLKTVLAKRCGIPVDKQVLLISGGESLNDEDKVCKYNAGTDTNPIFLFSLLNIESPDPPEILLSNHDIVDEELELRAEKALDMPDTQTTVSVRATLAQDYVKASHEQTRICETLIHDQHLQHQGWQAVVANLEDTGTALEKRCEVLHRLYSTYLQQRGDYRQMIETFDDDLAVLHQIPVFPSLLEAERSKSMVGSVIPQEKFAPGASITLLDWINSRGTSSSLEQVADGCFRAIEVMDEELMDNLSAEVTSVLESSKVVKMKEIRGLSERLQGLEQILMEAKTKSQDQQELAQAFLHNQQRASGLRDDSILPDLCRSHRQQLKVMAENYRKIVSIRKRCEKAKSELAANLHHRMKWVVRIQDQMADNGQNLAMYGQELARLNKKLEVIEQIHAAPSMYIASAVEVVRRKHFSDRFLARATTLSSKFATLYHEEVVLRQNFQAKLKCHFLSKMFPGMEDVPPAFATEAPEAFDHRLPDITLQDVEELRQKFPDLAKSLRVPDEDTFASLLARSFYQSNSVEDNETLHDLQNMPQKIHITGHHVNSVSVMHKLVNDPPAIRAGKKTRSKASRDNGSPHSETDSDDNDVRSSSHRFRGRHRQAVGGVLTRSLPLEDSTMGALVSQPPAQPLQQHEPSLKHISSFEFKVDKSVDPSCSSADPSSSSGANTAANTSVAPSSSSDGSVMKQIGGDDSTMLTKSDQRLSERLRSCMGPTQASLQEIRESIAWVRQQLRSEKAALEAAVGGAREALAGLEAAQEAQAALTTVEAKQETEKLQQQLELELNKLDDCHREIDIYRNQLQSAAQMTDRLREELADAKEQHQQALAEAAKAAEADRDGLVQKMTLEHELEMEALRQTLGHDDQVVELQAEIDRLRGELTERSDTVSELRRKTKILESTQEEKFHLEKDKIVQILEAGFVQREKLAVQECQEQERAEADQRLAKLKAQHQAALGQMEAEYKAKMNEVEAAAVSRVQQEYEEKMLELQTLQSKEMEIKLLSEKKVWEEDRDRALKTQADRLKYKARCELDSLRSRFKVMQTAGALDRSPSASESELSMESPRTDLLESIRASVVNDYENRMRLEQQKWQVKLEEEQRRAEAECLASSEKAVGLEKTLTEVRLALGLPQDINLSDLASELRRRLDKVDQEAMKRSMSSSVMRVPSVAEDVESLQRENQELRHQLSSSMHAVISGNSVSTRSVNKGEVVMVVWNDDHHSFAIYYEGPMLYFVHTDSLAGLDLEVISGKPNKRYLTAEVTDKEFCQAKKAENRFRVAVGTKFYRVKCKKPNTSAGQ